MWKWLGKNYHYRANKALYKELTLTFDPVTQNQ